MDHCKHVICKNCLIVFCPVCKEREVNLKLLEPEHRIERIPQIIGRAERLSSHKYLPRIDIKQEESICDEFSILDVTIVINNIIIHILVFWYFGTNCPCITFKYISTNLDTEFISIP